MNKIMGHRVKTQKQTREFAAPEVLNDYKGDYDGKSADIFSLGVVFYSTFMLKFPDINNIKGLWEGAPQLSDCVEFRKVIEGMLVRDPSKRPLAEDLLKDPWFKKKDELTKEEKEEIVEIAA